MSTDTPAHFLASNGPIGRMHALARMQSEGRRVRRKPRSPEQERMLMLMAESAVRRRAASGQLERLGPREYVLHPSVADVSVRERD